MPIFNIEDYVLKVEDNQRNEGEELCGLYFIPNFITPEEEEKIVNEIYKAPKPKWVTLKARRLQNWGGLPPKSINEHMIAEALPPTLENLCKLIYSSLVNVKDSSSSEGDNIIGKEVETNYFFPSQPNHILINEYLPGQGIDAHEDGPVFESFVAILNLESAVLLKFYAKPNVDLKISRKEVGRVIMEERGLLLMTGKAYSDYLHGIDPCLIDLISLPSSYLPSCLQAKQDSNSTNNNNSNDNTTTNNNNNDNDNTNNNVNSHGGDDDNYSILNQMIDSHLAIPMNWKFCQHTLNNLTCNFSDDIDVKHSFGWNRKRRISMTFRIVKNTKRIPTNSKLFPFIKK